MGGKTKSKSKLPTESFIGAESVIASLFPTAPDTDIISEYTKSLGVPIKSSLAGFEGVIAPTLLPSGELIVPREGGMLLPDISYKTYFQKAQEGKLTDIENLLLGKAVDLATNPQTLNLQGINLGAGTGGGGSVKFTGVPDIGTLTTNIINNLPPQMQTFINNIFQDSSPEVIQQELDNFANAMLQEAQSNAESLGGQLLSQFSAMGLGTSGTAVNALKQVAVETATRVNSIIAQSRLQMLDTLIRARDIGVNLVNVLGNLGATEQANIVRGKIAEMEAQAQILQSQLYANAQVQSALINAQADLQREQMRMLGNLVGASMEERRMQENAELIPYQFLLQLATGMTPTQRQKQVSPLNITANIPVMDIISKIMGG